MKNVSSNGSAGVAELEEPLMRVAPTSEEEQLSESKLIVIRAVCVGISPLLMNPATDELLEELRTGQRQQVDRNIPAIRQAEKKLCKDDEGRIGIRAINLRSSLVEAGRHVKFDGKKSVSTAESTLLDAFLQIQDFFLPFPEELAKAWVPDKRKGNLDNGTAVCIVRPRFDKWSFTVTIEIDEAVAKDSTARRVFDMAGSRVGLCDFRPAKRGPFGRFKVTEWGRISTEG
jgi:hypothetical protein